jgi:hypothetical protein
MNFDDIMLDLKCVEIGLPPMSGDLTTVSQVITSLKSSERKKVTRKLKKLCKRFIAKKRQNLKARFIHSQEIERRMSRAETNLGFKSDRQLFNNVTLMRRISFVRSFVRSNIKGGHMDWKHNE